MVYVLLHILREKISAWRKKNSPNTKEVQNSAKLAGAMRPHNNSNASKFPPKSPPSPQASLVELSEGHVKHGGYKPCKRLPKPFVKPTGQKS